MSLSTHFGHFVQSLSSLRSRWGDCVKIFNSVNRDHSVNVECSLCLFTTIKHLWRSKFHSLISPHNLSFKTEICSLFSTEGFLHKNLCRGRIISQRGRQTNHTSSEAFTNFDFLMIQQRHHLNLLLPNEDIKNRCVIAHMTVETEAKKSCLCTKTNTCTNTYRWKRGAIECLTC